MAGIRLQRVDDCTAAFSKGAAMSRHAHVIFRGWGTTGPTPHRIMTLKSVVDERERERKCLMDSDKPYSSPDGKITIFLWLNSAVLNKK